jgi:hypothetical protein
LSDVIRSARDPHAPRAIFLSVRRARSTVSPLVMLVLLLGLGVALALHAFGVIP